VINPPGHTTRLVAAYRCYLSDGNSPRYAAAVNRFYWNNSLLAILARGDIEMRRAAALALGMLGDHAAIEPLGRALSDPDRGVRLAADDSFRALLMRDAAPMHHQRLLQVMHLNDGGEHAAALAPTLILADQAPCYAEVHHQLAVCWQGLEDLDAAEAAYCSCLWHCRYHYPAWLGLARCRLAAGDYAAAIEALERALEICPDLEAARAQIRALRRRSRHDS
jgi:tetratricopeptide (TPR) repeat protein